MRRAVLFSLLLLAPARPGTLDRAASIGSELREAAFDPETCYRVRDLTVSREEVRLYLTDGYLIFAKPVHGRRVAAVFTAEAEGGDAEILLMPPQRSERLSLANFSGSPNLNEHFRQSLMLFTDGSGEEFLDHIRKTAAKPAPEMAAMLADRWQDTLRNIYSSFGVRIVQDLLSPQPGMGFFFAALNANKSGTLDLVVDPRAREQITLGRLTPHGNRTYYDIWCHFQGRSWRTGRRPVAGAEFRLSRFRIDALVEPSLKLNVSTRVAVTPAMDLSTLAFEVSPQMRVTEVTVDGQPAEVFQRESLRATLLRGGTNEVFLVVPGSPVVRGRTYELEFRHEGDVVSPAGNGVYFVGSRGTWYPNRDLQFADYEFTFRYPQTVSLVGTGELIDQRTEGDLRIDHRKTSSPVRLAGFNLGDYQFFTASESGLTVDVYANRRLEAALTQRSPSVMIVPPNLPSWERTRRPAEVITLPPPPPPSPAARSQALANEIASGFQFFASRFGPPPSAHLTVSPIPGRFGQGFPGLIYLSTLAYLSPKERPGVSATPIQIFFSELLHAHEVAHQWWGNIVTTEGYQDAWIMEALANYSALMYLEKKKGTSAMEEVLEDFKRRLLAKREDGKTIESVGPITWGLRLESSQAPAAWQVITYENGAWIFHMLRRRIGDEAFNRMLAELVKRYRYRALSNAELQALAAEFLPKGSPDPKLEAFFDNWVYEVGIPSLKLSYSVKGKAPNLILTASVAQTEVSQQFTAYVPVEIQTARGKTIYWAATGDEAPLVVKLRQPPVKVSLDPNNSTLSTRR